MPLWNEHFLCIMESPCARQACSSSPVSLKPDDSSCCPSSDWLQCPAWSGSCKYLKKAVLYIIIRSDKTLQFMNHHGGTSKITAFSSLQLHVALISKHGSKQPRSAQQSILLHKKFPLLILLLSLFNCHSVIPYPYPPCLPKYLCQPLIFHLSVFHWQVPSVSCHGCLKHHISSCTGRDSLLA